MRPIPAILLVLLAAYVLAVAQNDGLIRNQPKFARFFVPPAFQFSHSIFEGNVRPFQIHMPEARIGEVAASTGLVRQNCDILSRIAEDDTPPTFCFTYPLTGTFWNIWTRNGSIVGVRIYTTTNVEI